MARQRKTWSQLSPSYRRRLTKSGMTARKYNRKTRIRQMGFKSEYEYRKYRGKVNRPGVPSHMKLSKKEYEESKGSHIGPDEWANIVKAHKSYYGTKDLSKAQAAILSYYFNVYLLGRMTPAQWYLKYHKMLAAALKLKSLSQAEKDALQYINYETQRSLVMDMDYVPLQMPEPTPDATEHVPLPPEAFPQYVAAQEQLRKKGRKKK